jgi:molecular chaperone Hsp33
VSDHLIRGFALQGRARVLAAETTGVVEALREIHEPSRTVTAAMGRVATGALLMAAGLEKATAREPMVTIEVSGDGPAGKIMATASPTGWVRSFVANPAADAERITAGKLNVAGVVGTSGFLVVTRDTGASDPYRGVVPLFSGEIAEDLAVYLNESEQTPSAVLLGVLVGLDDHTRHSGGLMIQLLPGVGDDEATTMSSRVAQLGHLTTQLDDGCGPEAWLEHVFGGDVEITDRTPVEFRCGCSRDRVERAIKLLGISEIQGMLDDRPDSDSELTCEFCRTSYPVSPAELRRLAAEVRSDLTAN